MTDSGRVWFRNGVLYPLVIPLGATHAPTCARPSSEGSDRTRGNPFAGRLRRVWHSVLLGCHWARTPGSRSAEIDTPSSAAPNCRGCRACRSCGRGIGDTVAHHERGDAAESRCDADWDSGRDFGKPFGGLLARDSLADLRHHQRSSGRGTAPRQRHGLESCACWERVARIQRSWPVRGQRATNRSVEDGGIRPAGSGCAVALSAAPEPWASGIGVRIEAGQRACVCLSGTSAARPHLLLPDDIRSSVCPRSCCRNSHPQRGCRGGVPRNTRGAFVTRVLYLTCGEGLGDGLIASQVDRLLDARARAGDEIVWVALVPLHKLIRQPSPPAPETYRRLVIPILSRNLWIDRRTVERDVRATGALIAALAGEVGMWSTAEAIPQPYWDFSSKNVSMARGWYSTREGSIRKRPKSLVLRQPGPHSQQSGLPLKSSFCPRLTTSSAFRRGCACILRPSARLRRAASGWFRAPAEIGTSPVPPERRRLQTPENLLLRFTGNVDRSVRRSGHVCCSVSVLGEARLTVIGEVDPVELRARIEAKGAKATDVIVEKVSQERVFDLLCNQDLGLLPRTDSLVNRVSWPAKLSEYLIAGLPVAANLADSNIAEVLQSYEALVLVANGRVNVQDGVSLGSDAVRVGRAMQAQLAMSTGAVLLLWGECGPREGRFNASACTDDSYPKRALQQTAGLSTRLGF